jgi:enamine deaminase RidA (YjgF/YER057c/UK114 family)
MPRPLLAAFALALMLPLTARAAEPIHIDLPIGHTQWRAVVVPANVPLAHTAQFLASDLIPAPAARVNSLDIPADIKANIEQSKLEQTAAKQLLSAYSAMTSALGRASAYPSQIVKLNVYVTTPTVVPQLRKLIERDQNAAISWVVTPLPNPRAVVAIDAVAVADTESKNVEGVAILPPGGATYISGQAEKGADLAAATKATMAGLGRTLEHLGLAKKDVVQVKSFCKPMTDVAAARAEIEASFGGAENTPPLVWVETTQNTTTEIEMIAAAPRKAAAGGPNADTLEFIHPPWFPKPSPVYSKVAIVRGGQLIYTSGLYASKPSLAPEDEVKDIFSHLQELITKSGSDFKHLAKATYYPAAEPGSTALNKLRPEYYDPQRPPAASKMAVHGTGMPGHTVTMDIIAVTPK